MIRKKSLWMFLFYLFLGGCIGGVAGGVLTMGKEKLIELYQTCIQFLGRYMIWALAITDVLIWAVCGTLVFLAVRRYRKWSHDPERVDETVAPLVDWSTVSSTGGIILLFVAYGLYLQNDAQYTDGNFRLGILLFLFGTFSCLVLEILAIRFLQKIHPGKKGDPLSLKFSKQWMESCDELEKRVQYLAAYRTMMGLKYVIIGLFTLLLMLSMVYPIGVLPYLVLAAVWFYTIISTTIYSHRLSRNGNVD